MKGYYWELRFQEGTKFNPDQPRVPAGDPRGGQWTTAGSMSGLEEEFAQIAKDENISREGILGGGVTDSYLLSFSNGQKGVWKRDQPVNRADAEVLADRLDDLLGINVVPKTVFMDHKPEDAYWSEGSCQRFIENATTAAEIIDEGGDTPYYEAIRANRERMETMIFLDWMNGNRDRHFGNFIFDEEGKVWAVDNGQGKDWEKRAGKAFAHDLEPEFVRKTDRFPLTSQRLKDAINRIDSFMLMDIMKGTRYERYFDSALVKLRYVQRTGELKW